MSVAGRCLPVFAGLTLGVASAAAQPEGVPRHLNLPQTFADTKAILASGGVASVLVIGDSLSVREGSYLPSFTQRLQSVYGNAGAGYQGFSIWTGGFFSPPGWVNGRINQDTSPHHSVDGLWSAFFPPAGFTTFATFTPRSLNPTLHYLAEPGGGTILINHPAFPEVTINTHDPVGMVRTATFRVTSDQPAARFTPSNTGPVTLLGVDNRTGEPGIVIHRAANGGWGVPSFLRRNFTFNQQVALLNPSLVMIWLGQNDQQFDQNTYPVFLGQVVGRIRQVAPQAEFLLIGTYDSDSAALPSIVRGVHALAQQQGLGFINIYAVAGPYDLFEARGYLDDGLHHNAAGGQYIADILADAFLTDGQSLNCDRIDINGDGVFPDDADLLAFLAQLSGSPCPTCSDPDFNNDGVFPDDADLQSYLTVLAGGSC